MWQKKLKTLRKQQLGTAKPKLNSTSSQPASVSGKTSEINFKHYCQELGVKQLAQNQVVATKKPDTKFRPTDLTTSALAYEDVEFFDEQTSVAEFFRYGQRQLPRQLREGKFKIEQRLDLHHYTKAHALSLLEQLLEHADPGSVLCIIHGIGTHSLHNQPVLLGSIRKYLQQHQRVLAFSYALANQGGNGATLVKLKTQI